MNTSSLSTLALRPKDRSERANATAAWRTCTSGGRSRPSSDRGTPGGGGWAGSPGRSGTLAIATPVLLLHLAGELLRLLDARVEALVAHPFQVVALLQQR